MDGTWFKIRLPAGFVQTDLLRALPLMKIPVRLGSDSDAGVDAELYCRTEAEAAEQECVLRQVLADQRLRNQIEQECGPRIRNIVDSLLAKASGG